MCPGRGHLAEGFNSLGLHPTNARDFRRRSADIGGLHLATTTTGQGQGWMGGDHASIDTVYAEALSDMHVYTNKMITDNSLPEPPVELPSSVRSRLIHSLDHWNFEPHMLPDEEQVECTLILFEALFRIEGMQEAIPFPMRQISAFIHHLRRIYRSENSYHNFEHALDVLQATQSYLKSAGMVPSPTILFNPNQMWTPKKPFNSAHMVSCLGVREMFILYVAAIGHDVGHPGLSNIFMKNAKTPLSFVYDDSSALENLHCMLLLQLMKLHDITVVLEDPRHGGHLRRLLQKSVLATDMSVHKDFMERMKLAIEGEMGPICTRQITICQAILKNADISNPTRPFLVSKHWANALMQEWTLQAQLEEELQLQPSVTSSDDPIKEAGGQIFFITYFAKPLLELTQRAIPEMNMYTQQCKQNLKTWKKRKQELTNMPPSQPPSVASSAPSSPAPPSTSLSILFPETSSTQISPRIDPFNTAFPLSLPANRANPESLYSQSYSGRSENESAPVSPTESESASSAVFSSVSDGSSSQKALSVIAGSVAGSSSSPPPPPAPAHHVAIRAASQVGSLRQVKEARARKASRNSWSVTTPGTISTMFTAPGPSGQSAAVVTPPRTPGEEEGDSDTPRKPSAAGVLPDGTLASRRRPNQESP